MLGRAALCAALAWIAACGSDSPTNPGGPPSNSPVGNYTISTVNGKGLPFSLFSGTNYLLQVTAGTIDLTNDGKYALITTTKQTIPGNVEVFVDSSGGTWVLSGTTINLTDGADGSTGAITWSGTVNQLTYAISIDSTLNTFVYTKK